MRNRILLFLIFLICFTAKPQAVNGLSVLNCNQEKYDIEYIGIEKGLANNAVTSVYKDKRGLMWFGTYDGISRYDGYNFMNFRNEPNELNSLVNNRVVSICGTQNEIWIGTKGGISVYSYLNNQFNTKYFVNARTSKSELIDFVVNEIRDHKSNIYIATAGKGLLYRAAKQKKITQIPLYINGKLQWDYHMDLHISEAASIVGFGDIKYFRKHFQQFYNLNPSEFKKKYQNVKDNKYILNESFWKSS